MDFPFVESWNAPVCFLLRFLQQTFLLGSKFDSLAVSNPIWVWVNTYRYIFSGMNIHLPAILGFTRYQGFDPSPFVKSCFSHFDAMTSLTSPTNLWTPPPQPMPNTTLRQDERLMDPSVLEELKSLSNGVPRFVTNSRGNHMETPGKKHGKNVTKKNDSGLDRGWIPYHLISMIRDGKHPKFAGLLTSFFPWDLGLRWVYTRFPSHFQTHFEAANWWVEKWRVFMAATFG